MKKSKYINVCLGIILITWMICFMQAIPIMASTKNTKVTPVQWDEMWPTAADTTAHSVHIKGFCWVENELSPQGIEIYRKEKGSDYVRIHTVKLKENGEQYQEVDYIDKSVLPRTRYSYKMRSYRKVNGKMVYSKFTCKLGFTTINDVGQFDVEVLTPNKASGKRIEIKMTSDPDNANLYIEDDVDYCSYVYRLKKNEKYEGTNLIPYEYSINRKTWKSLHNKKITIKPKQTIYLAFRSEDNSDFPFLYDKIRMAKIYNIYSHYNGYNSLVNIDLRNRNARVSPNGEYYY